jgi:hypothetical protein
VELVRIEPRAARGRRKDPGHEVVLTPDNSARGREDEPELVRPPGHQLLAEDSARRWRVLTKHGLTQGRDPMCSGRQDGRVSAPRGATPCPIGVRAIRTVM